MMPIRGQVRGPRIARLRRAVAGLVGRVVLLLSLWSAMLLIVAGLYVLTADRSVTAAGLVQWILGAAASAGALRLGLKLTRGQRNLVLFLRKFGYRDAITVVNRSVASAMRRRWRLITLDDADIEPIGVPEARHWVVAVIAGLGIALMLAGFEYFFGVEGVGPVAGFILVALIHVAATEGNRAFAARSANTGKSRRLRKLAQSDALARRFQRISGRVVAPPLMVVTVDDHIWQEAVERLAAVATTVLIDISDPTENLLWEIKTLRPDVEGRWVFMCEERRFRRGGETDQRLDRQEQLDRMLAGEEVVLYSASDVGQLRQFSKVLRRKLESDQRPLTAS